MIDQGRAIPIDRELELLRKLESLTLERNSLVERSNVATAKRATAIERERCLAVIALYVNDWTPTKDHPGNSIVSRTLLDIGAYVAGGDAGPHSDAALAWRRHVTGERNDDDLSEESMLGATS